MGVFLAALETMEVCYNGPMRSGMILDSQALLNAGYRGFQQQLVKKLRDLYLGHWDIPPLLARRNHLSFDLDTFQGDTLIPRYLISRAFIDEDLDHILEEFRLQREMRPARTAEEGERRDAKSAPASFRIERIEIYLYDFGYASCMISGSLTALKDLSLDDCREAVDLVGAALPDFSELFQETIGKVAKIIAPAYVIHNLHGDNPVAPRWPGTAMAQHVGELFWMHRVFSVPCADAVEFARKSALAKELVKGERATVENKSLRDDMVVYPGHGNSCVVYIREQAPEWNIARLRSVIRAMNVFYAALQDADRDLFRLNNDSAQAAASHDSRAVAQQAEALSLGLARAGFVKSVYDDYDNLLDTQSFAIWDHLRRTWFMGDLFRGLDQKAGMGEKNHDRLSRRHYDLQDRSSRIMTSMIVLMFCLALTLPALRGPGQNIATAIVLAFTLGTATLIAVRYFKTK